MKRFNCKAAICFKLLTFFLTLFQTLLQMLFAINSTNRLSFGSTKLITE